MKKILFYAPLGYNIPIEKIGGAEMGCRKTMQIYQNAGYEVITLDKPAMSRGKLRYALEMLLLPLKLWWKITTKADKDSPVHIVGFYRNIVKFEYLLMKLVKWTGHKVIYELRNGSMIWSYQNGNNSYRKTLKNLLLDSDIVLCQGQEYVDFIKSKWGIERSYYPNCIMDDFIRPNVLNRPQPIKLIYFGRITEQKNVDVIIETLALVRKQGINAILQLIGGYDESYYRLLINKIEELQLNDFVEFFGRRPFCFIAEKLRDAHYFIFPSEEKQEGHSNSLTEAMGCGVVPIVSTAGFNASICGFSELVIDTISPEKFADKVVEIENGYSWGKWSEKVYQRIIENYTQKIISKKLISYIEPLFDK